MFRSIIVPLDGSAFGDYALPYAEALARRHGAVVYLVHVHHPFMPGEALEPLPHFHFQRIAEFDLAADAHARDLESDRLWEKADRLAGRGVAAVAQVLTGRVVDAITQFARGAEDALVVMSTHGRSGFHRAWLGSVADAVVRHARTPVLLVRPSEAAPPSPEEISLRRVLVPVDGSDFSTTVLGPVADLADGEPAEVTLLEVAPPPEDAAAVPVDDDLARLSRSFQPWLSRPGVRRVSHPHPAATILDEAEMGAYDLIAMATHGRGGAHHLLLGSTADAVMRATRKPILLYRPHLAATRAAPGHSVGVEQAFAAD